MTSPFEIGKTYRTRGGRHATYVGPDGDYARFNHYRDDGSLLNAALHELDGRYRYGIKSKFDLIPPEPERKEPTVTTTIYEELKDYQTEDGCTARIAYIGRDITAVLRNKNGDTSIRRFAMDGKYGNIVGYSLIPPKHKWWINITRIGEVRAYETKQQADDDRSLFDKQSCGVVDACIEIEYTPGQGLEAGHGS